MSVNDLWDTAMTALEDSYAARILGIELTMDLSVWIWSVAIFWIWNIPYLILDLTHWPSSLYKYKLQKHEVSWADVIRCSKRVLINQVFVALPVILISSPVLRLCGVHSSHEIPSISTILSHLVAFVLIEEIFFYYTHRFLHYWRYSEIHKIHHEFRAPIGIASEYAHWVEYIGSNLCPLLLGPMFMSSHFSLMLLWVTIAVIGTSNHHCGYRLPWLVGLQAPQFHDYHHYSFTNNFGLIGLLDWLYATDSGYKNYQNRVKLGPIS